MGGAEQRGAEQSRAEQSRAEQSGKNRLDSLRYNRRDDEEIF
jgi:hypothetical protein